MAKIFFSVLLLVSAILVTIHRIEALNNRPIIGVLLQEQHDIPYQMVASSYIKFVESGGARAVPIFVDRDRKYLEQLTDQINGVLMPGGGTPLLHSKYSQAADTLLELATAKNDKGIYFPVWATCLSFEKLITYYTGNQDLKWESSCNVDNLSLNLNFSVEFDPKTSKLFRDDAHEEVHRILAAQNVTANYHHICLNESTFRANKNLTDQFSLVSTNTHGGVNFVSTIEHRKYPIYGTQWHPEKNQFEFVVSATIGHINHDYSAVQVGQYFGNFLVNEARRNDQKFLNATEEAEALIYNYHQNLVYTGKANKSSFEEIYRFPMNDTKAAAAA